MVWPTLGSRKAKERTEQNIAKSYKVAEVQTGNDRHGALHIEIIEVLAS